MAKKELSISEFREIIKEEALKLKKRMVLENEKKALMSELKSLMSESYLGEDEMVNELFEHKKARNDFKATHKVAIEAMMKAYKEKDPSYVQLATDLKKKVVGEYQALAKKYGISGQSDMGALHKDLMKIAEPMDVEVFQGQLDRGGASVQDFVSGSGSDLGTKAV